MKIKQKIQKYVHDKNFEKEAKKRRDTGFNMKRCFNLHGKKAVIFGVATDKSIAWHIAKTLNDNGARIALGYQDRVDEYVKELSKELDNPVLGKCDMTKDTLIEKFFTKIEKEFGKFDILVHSVAFAKKDFLSGKFYDVTRRGYSTAQEVSAYSLAALIKYSNHLINKEGSIMAMTYLGATRAILNYNVMGVCKAALEANVRYLAQDLGPRNIRVNAISAGPIKTLAASGVNGFDKMLEISEKRSLLKRNIDAQDVANLALFLSSDLSRNITGQTIYVDSGYSKAGL